MFVVFPTELSLMKIINSSEFHEIPRTFPENMLQSAEILHVNIFLEFQEEYFFSWGDSQPSELKIWIYLWRAVQGVANRPWTERVFPAEVMADVGEVTHHVWVQPQAVPARALQDRHDVDHADSAPV